MRDTITRRDAFHVLDLCRFASEAEKKYAYSLMEQVESAQPSRNCETCRYNSVEWNEEPCDSFTMGGESNYYKPSAQPEPQWIPCSERLPERGVSVLISHVGYVYEDYLDIDDDDGELYFWNSGLFLYDERQNIAWMPLPEPCRAERRTDEQTVSE